jgi:uncharacterized repeat protein (TIGR03803 family)
VASRGGANAGGTVFKVSPAGVFSVVHDFGAPPPLVPSNTDGYFPIGLSKGTDGNFYGVAEGGGANSSGVIFSIAPDDSFNVVYVFGATVNGVQQAQSPTSLVIQASDGNLYGTASLPQNGVIYKVSPQGVYSQVYGFNPSAGDGGASIAPLLEYSPGVFYGTGSRIFGLPTLFKLTSSGQYTVLHTASKVVYGNDNSNGAAYETGLTKGNDGNLYGSATWGGAFGSGVMFRMTPAGTMTTLYNFGGLAGDPLGGAGEMLLDSDGNLYGVTSGLLNGSAFGNSGAIVKFTLPPPAGWGIGPKPAVTFSVQPTSVTPNTPLTLTWSSATADYCALQQVAQGTTTPVATSGSTQINAPAIRGVYTYDVTCVQRGVAGRSGQSVTVQRR